MLYNDSNDDDDDDDDCLGEAAMWRAQMYGNTELYQQAKNLVMRSCDRLRELKVGY